MQYNMHQLYFVVLYTLNLSHPGGQLMSDEVMTILLLLYYALTFVQDFGSL